MDDDRTAQPGTEDSAADRFTATLDRRRSVVTARGRLTQQAGDLLRGVCLAMQGAGHGSVVLDLAGTRPAEGCDDVLPRLERAVGQGGGHLVVLHGPPGGER